MEKLIEFIRKIHWKIYGKNHLLSELRKGADMAIKVHHELGKMGSDSCLRNDNCLEKRLNDYTEAIKDVEAW